MRYFVFSGIFLLAVALGAVAQDLPDVDQFGPQVGDVVPAFSLPDQSGQAQTVESIMGPQGAMLVFSRSADW
ncbi:MAG: hypothetical protein ABGY72_21220 [bacterium]